MKEITAICSTLHCYIKSNKSPFFSTIAQQEERDEIEYGEEVDDEDDEEVDDDDDNDEGAEEGDDQEDRDEGMSSLCPLSLTSNLPS